MPKLLDLAQTVTDERSFVKFLTAMREDCESSPHNCEAQYASCLENEHWQTLKSYKRQAVMVVTFLLAVFVFFAIQPDLIHEIRHRHLPNINKSIRQTTEKWLDYF